MPSLSRTLLLCSSLCTLCQAAMPLPARAEVTLDGTLGPAGALPGPDFAITADLGRQVGGNLFHSFAVFDLLLGQSATFSGPTTVANIIARVTGGNESFIDGLLRSTIPGADLFLLNPAGVVFGPHASLDLQGSFHVSTADSLTLGDSGRFAALHPEASELSADPPSAFGFLGNEPAAITFYGSGSADAAEYLPSFYGLNGNGITVQEGETISVVGGDIQLQSGNLFFGNFGDWAVETRLTAPGGTINLASMASAGELPLATMDAGGFSALGDISLSGLSEEGRPSRLEVSGEGGGAIVIRGNSIMIDAAQVLSHTTGAVGGQGIDIGSRTSCTLKRGGVISADTFGAGDGGSIAIETADLELADGGHIWADVNTGATGRGGTIQVSALNTVSIEDQGSFISADTFGAGDGGSIFIDTGRLVLTNGGQIWADANDTAIGHGGDIQVSATDAVNISDAGSFISASTFGAGDGGSIALDTGRLALTNGGQIWAEVLPGATGQGGDILVSATDTVRITDVGSFISASTAGAGDGGAITFDTGRLELFNGGSLWANVYLGATGRGGDIQVTAADAVSIAGAESFISASTVGAGRGGSISITATNLDLANSGAIGAITEGPGQGGSIQVTATDSVTITDAGSRISADTSGDGDGGSIVIAAANRLHLYQGGVITTTTYSGNGDAGDITVQGHDGLGVHQVLIEGYDDDVVYPLPGGGEVTGAASGIYLNTTTTGDGGSLALTTDLLEIRDGGVINAIAGFGADSETQGGDIAIAAGSVQLSGGGVITAATFGRGAAGSVTVNATDAITISGVFDRSQHPGVTNPRISDHSGINNSSSQRVTQDAPELGPGGFISVRANALTISDRGEISVANEGQGSGGHLVIDSGQLTLLSEGRITSSSTGRGLAGTIAINAGRMFYSHQGQITAAASDAGGGDISLRATDRIHLVQSAITTSVQGGDGNGGNITIDPQHLILDHSRIEANAWGGRGGNIHLTAGAIIKDPASTVTASSVLGIDGVVTVDSPANDVAGALVVLPATFQTDAGLAGDRCAARTAENSSSLVLEGSHALLPGESHLLTRRPPPQNKRTE